MPRLLLLIALALVLLLVFWGLSSPVEAAPGEEIENAKVRGPLLLRTLGRAVTAEDYEHLAKEAAPEVRVNSILTGRFETDRIKEENRGQATKLGVDPAEFTARSIRNIPLGRHGRPDELAAAVVFLAGDTASFITGTTLSVDGGEYGGLF